MHALTPPLSPAQLETNFTRLLDTIAEVMDPPVSDRYRVLLLDLSADHTANCITYLGFKRAPAARANHHAFEGGLVAHILEMWDTWQALKAGKPELVSPPYITDARVLEVVLGHDLHKSHTHFIQVPAPPGIWRVRYGTHETDLLLNNTLKSLWLLNRAGIQLDPEQLHALGLSEGGWSDQGEIRTASALAKLVYALDELSGNVLSAIATQTQLGHHGPANHTYFSLS